MFVAQRERERERLTEEMDLNYDTQNTVMSLPRAGLVDSVGRYREVLTTVIKCVYISAVCVCVCMRACVCVCGVRL